MHLCLPGCERKDRQMKQQKQDRKQTNIIMMTRQGERSELYVMKACGRTSVSKSSLSSSCLSKQTSAEIVGTGEWGRGLRRSISSAQSVRSWRFMRAFLDRPSAACLCIVSNCTGEKLHMASQICGWPLWYTVYIDTGGLNSLIVCHAWFYCMLLSVYAVCWQAVLL